MDSTVGAHKMREFWLQWRAFSHAVIVSSEPHQVWGITVLCIKNVLLCPTPWLLVIFFFSFFHPFYWGHGGATEHSLFDSFDVFLLYRLTDGDEFGWNELCQKVRTTLTSTAQTVSNPHSEGHWETSTGTTLYPVLKKNFINRKSIF